MPRHDFDHEINATGGASTTSRSAIGAALLVITTALLALFFLAGLVWGYLATAKKITLTVDGLAAAVWSHEATVAELLAELQLELQPADRINLSLDEALTSGTAITIARARPVVLSDGSIEVVQTHAVVVGDVLEEAGLALGQADQLRLEGWAAEETTPLPVKPPGRARGSGIGPLRPWRLARQAPVTIEIRRALPLTFSDDGAAQRIWTTASTVGEALAGAGLRFFEGDLVEPPLGTPISSGLAVLIERSLPISIQTLAGVHLTRTRRETVGDLLAEQEIILAGLDRVDPPEETPLRGNGELAIRVTRVAHQFEIEEEITPYASVWEPDPELEIDTRRLDQEGANGITRWRYRTILEDGQPITTTLEDVWLAQQPVTRVLNYGTRIVLRELNTPDGPQTYWRKIRMFATSYAPDESGIPVDSPYYGLTRLGTKVRRGIVAVDPSVIRLRTPVYVPGYGVASAQDTGGLIDGRWIDLAYDHSGQMVPWSCCVDVYLLGEPPPSYQIEYFLPNYPTVPCLRQ